MTQQFHHSPYGMVVIARTGSMKFLPIMNGGMRRPAARTTQARAQWCRQNALQMGLRPFRGKESISDLAARESGWTCNESIRSSHHHVSLLVAALVLIWNVLGAR
ncbi:hypothetical protein [Bradyrhizobium yuanmingense]|uniref:hypothetical protein n=1 Tax=Bradyrhizobium yuanmingense TaxID=108015 RepID=UPI0023B8BBB1|nr:hypothetical protein [Bradyrhizobium yuanmingense]MDF0581102.1 hypothetical protein [Bradyrhizobium yuanmingense]